MEQIEKNTVEAKNQIKDSDCIKFFYSDKSNKGPRILFAGNSITLHAEKPDIGWYHSHGMAASNEESDYVHLLMKKVRELHPYSEFCIAQVAEFERSYLSENKIFEEYKAAKNFDADILIMRFIENVPRDNFNRDIFKKSYVDLIKYLCNPQKAKIIFTTGFWRHSYGDPVIREVAKDFNMPLVELGDLGEQDDMKALGLYRHEGVANHPGNKGMENIANRIFPVLENMI